MSKARPGHHMSPLRLQLPNLSRLGHCARTATVVWKVETCGNISNRLVLQHCSSTQDRTVWPCVADIVNLKSNHVSVSSLVRKGGTPCFLLEFCFSSMPGTSYSAPSKACIDVTDSLPISLVVCNVARAKPYTIPNVALVGFQPSDQGSILHHFIFLQRFAYNKTITHAHIYLYIDRKTIYLFSI